MKSISAVQEDLSNGWENVEFLKYIIVPCKCFYTMVGIV